MSYPPAPPPSGGVNPYGDVPEPDPSPVFDAPQPWQTPGTMPAYGTPPPTGPAPTAPTHAAPSDQIGYGAPGVGVPGYGDASRYSPYTPVGGGYPGTPGYGGWIANSRDNGKGTGALVLGILSIVLCFGSVLSIVLGVVSIVLGVQGRRAALMGTADNAGVATAGIVLGSIGCAMGLLASLGYLANALT